MSRTTWLLIGLCAVGAALGFWLMGVLVNTGAQRPELAQRLQSLPALEALPALAGPRLSLIDSLETPGGSVWALLAEREGAAGRATLCEFERKSTGGVQAPTCTRIEHALARVDARLAVGGKTPLLIAPAADAEAGAVAAHALTGQPHAVVSQPQGSVSVEPPRGARLVRHFQLNQTKRELSRVSPQEGYYVGPITGYANTRAPQVPLGTPGSLATCVTPAGYVHARAQPDPARQGKNDRLEVSFVSKGEVVAQVSGTLPQGRTEATLTCGPSSAIFTYLATDNSLGTLTCSPAGCERSVARLRDVNLDELLLVARLSSSTALVWRDSAEQVLWRLGPVESYDNSPTAPLFKPTSAAAPWQLSGSVGTGHSLLLFIARDTTHAVQVFADGHSETLTGRVRADADQ